MALTPNREVFITCALTGAGDTTGRSDKVPVTPEQVARAGVDAAPGPGPRLSTCTYATRKRGSRRATRRCTARWSNRVRDSGVDVVLNLTAGMGGDLTPRPGGAAGARSRRRGRISRAPRSGSPTSPELLPEICTPRLRDDELR